MNKSEKRAWLRLRPYIAKQPGMDYERVENMAGSGTPDVNLLGLCTATVQVELKARDAPKRERTPILAFGNYRTSQINWHAAAARTSSKTFVLVGLQGRPQYARDIVWWWYLFQSSKLKASYTMPRLDFAAECVVHTNNLPTLFDAWRAYLR